MIAFKDALGERWNGYQVHPDEEFICVIKWQGAYQIFNTVTGKPFLPILFPTKELALQFGAYLHQWYGEYFWLWSNKDWVQANIPQLVQYTIPNGVAIFETLQSVRHKTVTDLRPFMPYIREQV